MHKVKIMDINQGEQLTEKKLKNPKNRKNEKIIKIKDSLFEIAVRKGLIEKNEDGNYFIGDYRELLALKNKSSMKSFKLLD